MLKNLKLSGKLIAGFGIVIILMVVCVGVGTINLNNIGKQVQMYTDYTVPNNNSVWQMRRDLISVQRYLLIALTENDQAAIESNLKIVSEEQARIAATYETYKGNARVSQEEIDQLGDLVTKASPYIDDLSERLKRNNATDNAIAFEIYNSEFKPIADEAADLLSAIGEEQNQKADEQEIESTTIRNTAFILLLGTFIVSLILTIIVVSVIRRAILVPVKEVEEAAAAITQGNLDTTIVYEGKDEMGSLADSMRKLCLMLKTIISDEDYLLSEMANGNFDIGTRCEEYYIGGFESLIISLRSINVNLSNTLSQINTSADQVSAGSDQVSSGAQALSQGATEQASSVEELLATLNEVSEKIKENATESQNANKLSEETGREVQVGNEHMREMSRAMGDISEASSEIGKIIKTIEDIAFQTNILALNAAVEAARAGAAGKGFAVVADEVRSLASKSGEAAKNTTALIEGALSAVENGNKIVGMTAESLEAIVSKTSEVSGRIEKIAKASNEQSVAISQITQGVEQISAVVQANSATAEESAAASEELSGQAQILSDLVGQFNLRKH